MLTQFLILLLVGTAGTVLILGQQPVYHGVGIAADRRREVGIVVKGQSVVADVVGRILGLHHGPQGDSLYQLLLTLTLTTVHQCVERL